MNTYYVRSTVLGANQYKIYSQSCQWLAVWFRASPLILVCLISPTCQVGITVLSTYLPHRGVVRIHMVAFGALTLLGEVWHKHNILFFTVLPTFEDLRAKEFHIQPTAATSHSQKPSRRNALKGAVKIWLPFFSVIFLELGSFIERPLKLLSQIINSHTVFNAVYSQTSFFRCPSAHWNVDSQVLGCLCLIYLKGIKLRNTMGFTEVKGGKDMTDFSKQMLANL